MLLANRKTLLLTYGDIENEVRGTLRAFGLKLSAGSQRGSSNSALWSWLRTDLGSHPW
jgi:hypothetical protein